MARPLKKGLSYFPLDTDFLSDRKIQRLSRRYGCNGICVYVAVLCELYRENGYYVSCDTDFRFDIAFTLNISEELVGEILDYCIQLHLFDGNLYEYRRILTSSSVQRRYREVFRRNQPRILPELDLSETGDIAPETEVIAPETGVIVPETPSSAAETLEKEKEIKSKKNLIRNEHEKSIEYKLSAIPDDASARRAELQRMAFDATAGC
ncbi:DUF4373 domain-containing protein [Parabacteroides sp. AM08-6]|uniref:DUF4373 domain-containing protein n=1 Tax=Parabacteroides sp. AM08-6 TaxID=2292053 RepID=UPI000EFDD7E9|nr:DUF4373 domain-containing protein [Parabacteroides sp. AM08-6]RHJ82384.1 DUF4373 domain-containing protein [Parabacteroides sp. AM08-6]